MKHKYINKIKKHSLFLVSGLCITTGLVLTCSSNISPKTNLVANTYSYSQLNNNDVNVTYNDYFCSNYNPKYLFAFFNDNLKVYQKDTTYQCDIDFGLNIDYIGACMYYGAIYYDSYDWDQTGTANKKNTENVDPSSTENGIFTTTAKEAGWGYTCLKNLKAALDKVTYSKVINIMSKGIQDGKLFIAPIGSGNNPDSSSYSSFINEDKIGIFNIPICSDETSTSTHKFYVNYYNSENQNSNSAWKNNQNINYLFSNPTIFSNQGLNIDNPDDWQTYIDSLPVLKWKRVADNFGIGLYKASSSSTPFAGGRSRNVSGKVYNLLSNYLDAGSAFGDKGKIEFICNTNALKPGYLYEEAKQTVWGADTPSTPTLVSDLEFDFKTKFNTCITQTTKDSKIKQNLLTIKFNTGATEEDNLSESKKWCKYFNLVVDDNATKQYLPYFYSKSTVHYFSEWYTDLFIVSYSDVLGKQTTSQGEFYQPHQTYGGTDTWTTDDFWKDTHSSFELPSTIPDTCTPIFIKPLSIETSDCSLPSVSTTQSKLIPVDKKHIVELATATTSGSPIYIRNDLADPTSSNVFATIYPEKLIATGAQILEYGENKQYFNIQNFNDYLLSLSPSQFKQFFDTGIIDTGSKLWGKVICYSGFTESQSGTQLATAIPFFIDIQSEEITNIRELLNNDIMNNSSLYHCLINDEKTITFTYEIPSDFQSTSSDRNITSSDSISCFSTQLVYERTLNSCKDHSPQEIYNMDKEMLLSFYILTNGKEEMYTELFQTSLTADNLRNNQMFASEYIPSGWEEEDIIKLYSTPETAEKLGFQDPGESKTSISCKFNCADTTINSLMAFPYVLDRIEEQTVTYTWVDYDISPDEQSGEAAKHKLSDAGNTFEVKYFFGQSFVDDSTTNNWTLSVNFNQTDDTNDNLDVKYTNWQDSIKITVWDKNAEEWIECGTGSRIYITEDILEKDTTKENQYYATFKIELTKEWLNINMLSFKINAAQTVESKTNTRNSSAFAGMILKQDNPIIMDTTSWTTSETTKCFRAKGDTAAFNFQTSTLFKENKIDIFEIDSESKLITPKATFNITTKSSVIELANENWVWVADITDPEGEVIGYKIKGDLVQNTTTESGEVQKILWYSFECSQYSTTTVVEEKEYKNSIVNMSITKQLDESTPELNTLSPTYGHLNMNYTVGKIGNVFNQSLAMGEADPEPSPPPGPTPDPQSSWWTKAHIAGVTTGSAGVVGLLIASIAASVHNKKQKELLIKANKK